MKYKPSRQRIEGNIILSHGESATGAHVDCVMKSYKELSDDQLLQSTPEGYVYPLVFLREASKKEVSQYCIKK